MLRTNAALAMVVLALATPPGVTRDRTLTDPRIIESSDLVASALHPGLLWTTNDSGDGPRIFGVDPKGKTVAVATLRGARARDWEALAPGRSADGTPLLWVGDIGDNLGTWPSVRVYRIDEPTKLGNHDVSWTGYDLRYPDGPRNAETLLVNPSTGRLYVVSKLVEGAAVYEAPLPLRTDRVNVLTRVASAPALVTDGAFSPDGKTVALRDYVWAWRSSSVKGPWHQIQIPLEPQGESLTWTPDGRAVLIGSEGYHSVVWRVPMTLAAASRSATRSPSGSPGVSGSTPSATSGSAEGRTGSSSWRLLVGALALGATFSVAAAARRRNRTR
jgi:hypothetical protein